MTISVGYAWPIAVFLFSLRLGAVFAYAPPFTLMAAPLQIRVLLAMALAAWLVSASTLPAGLQHPSAALLVRAVVTEVLVGATFVFALQAAFGALYFAGRVLDVQTGFGLALLIDPSTANQVPLLGTFFAYAAGVLFFLGDGHHALLHILVDSTIAIPVGSGVFDLDPGKVIEFMSRVFAVGLAASAAGMIVLLLIDVSIAFLSRTLPQMNVLLFGLQVKTLVLLLVLAATFGVVGPLLLRVIVSALQFASDSL